MTTFMQWVHLMAAVVGLGGLAFLLLIMIPALWVLSAEQREALTKAVGGRFRWASWSAIMLLLISGLYNIRRYYWEEPWDRAWKLLTAKIVLSFILFAIILGLTIPLKWLAPLRARRTWLLVAFILGILVVVISAYLRRG
jgi:uncharacterized membrane protein